MVTLDFQAEAEGSRIVLHQGPFATEARRALHEAGWTDGFSKIAELGEG